MSISFLSKSGSTSFQREKAYSPTRKDMLSKPKSITFQNDYITPFISLKNTKITEGGGRKKTPNYLAMSYLINNFAAEYPYCNAQRG